MADLIRGTEREYRKLGRLDRGGGVREVPGPRRGLSVDPTPLPDRADPLPRAAPDPCPGRPERRCLDDPIGGTPMHELRQRSGQDAPADPPPAAEVAAPGAAVPRRRPRPNGACVEPGCDPAPAADRRQRVGRRAAGRDRGARLAGPRRGRLRRRHAARRRRPRRHGVGRFGHDFGDVRVHTDAQATSRPRRSARTPTRSAPTSCSSAASTTRRRRRASGRSPTS